MALLALVLLIVLSYKNLRRIKMKKVSCAMLLCFAVLLISSIAEANVTMTSSRTSFEALGTIGYKYGFDDYSTDPTFLSGYVTPGDPWTSHGVTYTSSQNLIGWTNYGYYTNGTPMMMNNYWNPVTGNIDPSGQYSLFGFDAGYGSGDDNGTVITISTNIQNYSFDVDLNRADSSLFYGFVSDSGEYFTGFNITTNYHNALASIDNVTLGNNNGQQSVPEPAAIFLFCSSLVGLAGYRKRFLSK
jgi:hypothetical protein